MLTRLLLLPFAVVFAIVPVPAAPPEAPPPRPALDPLADWTPRPATGQAEPWEKARDPDWDDTRFRLMDTGPALNCTMRYPLGKGHEMVYKATVVKLGAKGEASMVFDRATMRVAAVWTGGYLNHSDRRFGLLNTPTPKGEMIFANPTGPGWADPLVQVGTGNWDAKVKRFTAPLPGEWAKYRGMYVHGDRVVFRYSVGEREVYESPGSVTALSVEVGPGSAQMRRFLCDLPFRAETIAGKTGACSIFNTDERVGRIWLRHMGDTGYATGEGRVVISIPASDKATRFTSGVAVMADKNAKNVENTRAIYDLLGAVERSPDPTDLGSLTKGGPKRWGEPIVTPLVREDESGAFAVDTLTIPYKNRFNALFFCTGLDQLPDGRIAVSTCHGDVWLVKVDEKAATCSWQRYATGLYHPLGLKVVDGKVVVLERGQLTRLHDLNKDGEADYYECVSNDWDTGPGEHSYDTCLETDPQGNFYFFKTGDTDLPTGGTLMRVAKDGSKAEVFCTGFRHPIGMGMSPTGILTGADQEGNWMPATRIDEYKKGGFYGDMRAHHRKEAPKTFDPPLCWLPREVDNSAGGQVWVPEKTFGPLAGLPLHLSYGRCKAYVLLRQECANGVSQGGVADLGLKFLSGVCRGRFGSDGRLYVCGLNGWQTAAQADGCLQRVRYTGKPLDVPAKLAVDGKAIRLTFSREIDAKSVAKVENYKAAWWNYIWSGAYGSKRWKVSNPKVEGQDEFAPRSAKLLDDGRTVELHFDKLQPVMQMQVGYNLLEKGGNAVSGSVFFTINTTEK